MPKIYAQFLKVVRSYALIFGINFPGIYSEKGEDIEKSDFRIQKIPAFEISK